ncbi:hypothetical protein [Streptomyces sp. CoH27]|uniref:hypothetical protein n=1 Tax=Streptomyces sp. CoH27 TaxID=2875763 RepID=UPI001CD43871|nr:hypothetical protein [Streptomyces sp. CoH27]
MSATTPTRVSMHALLASCAAADAISRPPRDFECPEGATKGARGGAGHAAAAVCARPAATDPQPPDDPARHPVERKAA